MWEGEGTVSENCIWRSSSICREEEYVQFVHMAPRALDYFLPPPAPTVSNPGCFSAISLIWYQLCFQDGGVCVCVCMCVCVRATKCAFAHLCADRKCQTCSNGSSTVSRPLQGQHIEPSCESNCLPFPLGVAPASKRLHGVRGQPRLLLETPINNGNLARLILWAVLGAGFHSPRSSTILRILWPALPGWVCSNALSFQLSALLAARQNWPPVVAARLARGGNRSRCCL